MAYKKQTEPGGASVTDELFSGHSTYIEKGTSFPSKRLLLLFEGQGLSLSENNKEILIKEIKRLDPKDVDKVADYVDLIITRNY